MKYTHIATTFTLLLACSSGRHYDFQILRLDTSNQGILGDFEAQGNQLIVVYKGIIRITNTEAKVLFNIDTKGAEYLLINDTLKPIFEKPGGSEKPEITYFQGKRTIIFMDSEKPYIAFFRDPTVPFSDPGFSIINMKRIMPTEYDRLKREYEEARKQTAK